ncbi:MAG: GAF domain-containing protein [Chloroflexota bacterium]
MAEHRLTSEQSLPNPSIRLRVGLIISAGLVLLVGAVVGVTFGFSEAVARDGERVHLLDALNLEMAQSDQALAASATFEPTARALLDGGVARRGETEPVRVEPIEDAETKQSLEKMLAAWREFLRAHAQAQRAPADAVLFARVRDARAAAQTNLTEVTRLIGLRRADGIGMVRGMYATLFLSSLLFLLFGLWFMQQSVVTPVEDLDRIAHRIAAGDFDTPVALGGQGEFLDLTRSFETMRRELQRSRDQMTRWTRDLEAHVAERTQQISALSEVIAAASRSLELDTVLSTALQQSLKVIGAETGALWLKDDDAQNLQLAAFHGLPVSMREELRVMNLGDGVTGRAAETGQTIVLEDVSQSPGPMKAVSIREGMRSVVAVPIRLRDRVVGVLDVMARQPRVFTPEEIALLTSIGQQIGIAVDSLRLMQAAQQQARQVAALMERDRIGIELHDGLLQTLGYVYLKTDQLEAQAAAAGLPKIVEQLTAQRELIGEVSRDVRRFIADLREPPAPQRVSLQTALREMVESFTRENSLQAQLDLETRLVLLDAERSEHLVRIAREALINAAQHGKARRAVVRLMCQDEHAELSVQDDGSGFDPAQLSADEREHFGLSIMQARATRIGGTLRVESQPGQGVRVRVVFKI